MTIHWTGSGQFMFGFLNPRPHSDDYRRAYARLCVHQRRRFGVRSSPFHSYEAVFLYQLALDAGAFIAFDCAADKQRDSQLPAESSWKPNPTVLC